MLSRLNLAWFLFWNLLPSYLHAKYGLFVQCCGVDSQEAQNYRFKLDAILKTCHIVKKV